mgnify:CR=1 FL=1
MRLAGAVRGLGNMDPSAEVRALAGKLGALMFPD